MFKKMKIAIYWIIDYISLYYISFILFFFSFISDCIQISQILNSVKSKATVNASVGMFSYSFVVLVVMIGTM